MIVIPLAEKAFLPWETCEQVRHRDYLQLNIPTNGMSVKCLIVVAIARDLILLGAILLLTLAAFL